MLVPLPAVPALTERDIEIVRRDLSVRPAWSLIPPSLSGLLYPDVLLGLLVVVPRLSCPPPPGLPREVPGRMLRVVHIAAGAKCPRCSALHGGAARPPVAIGSMRLVPSRPGFCLPLCHGRRWLVPDGWNIVWGHASVCLAFLGVLEERVGGGMERRNESPVGPQRTERKPGGHPCRQGSRHGTAAS